MASRDTLSRDVEFGQLMVRVNELLDAEDGDDGCGSRGRQTRFMSDG